MNGEDDNIYLAVVLIIIVLGVIGVTAAVGPLVSEWLLS